MTTRAQDENSVLFSLAMLTKAPSQAPTVEASGAAPQSMRPDTADAFVPVLLAPPVTLPSAHVASRAPIVMAAIAGGAIVAAAFGLAIRFSQSPTHHTPLAQPIAETPSVRDEAPPQPIATTTPTITTATTPPHRTTRITTLPTASVTRITTPPAKCCEGESPVACEMRRSVGAACAITP